MISILTLIGALELGYAPILEAPYTQLQSEVVIADIIHVTGTVRTYFYLSEWNSNYPFQADYGVRVELQYRQLTAGFFHECRHTVVSEGIQPVERYGLPTHEEVYIRIKTGG